MKIKAKIKEIIKFCERDNESEYVRGILKICENENESVIKSENENLW